MKLVSRLTLPVLLLAVLSVGLYGIHRSLWLDESWVANSLREPQLHRMFFYPGWLQVTPPLFLLLARAALAVTGASSAALRAVPLLISLAAAALTWASARRAVSPAFAALAAVLVALDPTAIEYSHTLKPYSAELAASAGLLLASFRYLDQPDRKRLAWLLAAVTVSLPLAYSSVFLLPGIVVAMASRRLWNDAGVLVAVAAVVFLPLEWFLIRPNMTDALRAFAASSGDKLTVAVAAALVFCVARIVPILARLALNKATPRDRQLLICLAPCLLLAAAGALGIYPVSLRTRLFALPCLVLAVAMTAQDLLENPALRRVSLQQTSELAAVALAFLFSASAIAAQILAPSTSYQEDFAGAVAFLQKQSAPSDLILIHACCIEGFKLYSRLDHWTPPHVIYGETGWPCCVPGKDGRGLSKDAALHDIDEKIPRGYSGRVWLLYVTRPSHWEYVGLDEGNLWRNHLWQRGCPPGPYFPFANLAVSPMNCAGAR